ncbi:uncharacterized protein ATC70_003698 [Mucor velutinosus]|uniref:Uncharacterized protein n=1 Tax=Mucor velutinosus TaxID=708070 RepID=A0AAN7D8V4_9FUNG|nr:hypothetical protein ATC70_003698 [Mucor velutinosus]
MSSSLEKFNINFSHLSFDSPSPVLDLKSDRQQISQQAPQASLKRPGMTPRSVSRNKQCMPSDDEEEEEDEEDEKDEEQDSDNEINKVPRGGVQKLAISTPSMTKPMRKSRPLPSDDEDSEEEQDEHEQQQGAGGEKQHTASLAGGNRLHPNDNHAYQDYANYMQYQSYQQEEDDDDDDDRALVTNPNAGPVLTLVEGTHLQQLHQKQQQHQAQLAQFQYQQQQQQLQQHYYHPHHPHHHHQQQQHKSRSNVSMSGMDLLKQLEQEKADSKRIKPKLDTSKVKIEGLLGKLPEPGSHNISFQQIQQQQQQYRKKSQYLDPFTLEKSRSPSPSRNSHRISYISKQ